MTPHGHFHWNELQTRDLAAAKKLYADSVGWTFEEMPMPDGTIYIVCNAGGEPVGGMFDISKNASFEGMPAQWMSYVAIDDVDAALEKAKAAGAIVMGEPFDVQGVGRIAMVQQPDGAMVGWMTPSYEPMAA
jgi:predicted enzyme related to lactoylglutathione lyase